jgi:hypothetical protein
VVGSLVELVRAGRGLDHIRKLVKAVRRHEDSGRGGGVATQALERFGRSSQGEVEQAEDELWQDREPHAACGHELLEHVDVCLSLVFLSAHGLDRGEIGDVPARSPRLSDVEREPATFVRNRVAEVEAAAADQL